MSVKISEYENRETYDYDMFKCLIGNREVVERRKNKIIASVKSVGQLPIPILVNEKYEVVDGQGRLEAWKELGLPVLFLIQKGIGLKECQAINQNQEKWRSLDYIKSTATFCPIYKHLLEFYDEFPDFNLSQYITAIKNGQYWNGGYSKQVMNGAFQATDEEFENGRQALMYARRFFQWISFAKGCRANTYLVKAILFCYYISEVDNEVMYRQFDKYAASARLVKNVGCSKDALTCLEDIYNYNARKRKDVHLNTLYKKYFKLEPSAHIVGQ